MNNASSRPPSSPLTLGKLLTYGWPLLVLIGLWIFRQQSRSEGNSLGKELYLTQCGNCHGPEGRGLGKLIPPLAQADYWALNQSDIPCLLVKGIRDTIWVNGVQYTQAMPGNETLTPTQVYNLIDYINHAWGNEIATPDIQTVREQMKVCP